MSSSGEALSKSLAAATVSEPPDPELPWQLQNYGRTCDTDGA
jgi:hypothetical protein